MYPRRTRWIQRRSKSTIDSSVTDEHFAASPHFFEAFEYVIVNKRKEEQAVTVSEEGFMTPAARALRNAKGRDKINNPLQPVASSSVTQSAARPLSTQTDKPNAMQQGLQTSVHLRLSSTTLKAVLQTLATQTGLQVQTESYLEERKFVMELDDVSAQNALDTTAQ